MINKGRKVGGDRMSALDALKGDLDPLTKRIVFAGYFTQELEKKGFSPVATGNYAVELYTSGEHKSNSVDFVAPVDMADDILEKMEFIKEGDHWINKDVDITVRILAEDISEDEMSHVNQIDVNGLTVYVFGLEDVVLLKLKEFSEHRESKDIIMAQDLMEIHVNELDLDYLKEGAAKKNVGDALQKLIDELRLEEEEEE